MATTSKTPLIVERRTPAYWRVTIDNPPINLFDADILCGFQELIDELESDQEFKVVVFDSADPDFFIAHISIPSSFLVRSGESDHSPWPTGMSPWPDSGVPLIMVHRFRATIDHWDPALLDVLSSERDVIVFDNRGTTGRSSGTAFTRRLLPWPTPLRQLVVGATVPAWIAWIFIEQSLLWGVFHRLFDNQTATQQSRERLTIGWRDA